MYKFVLKRCEDQDPAPWTEWEKSTTSEGEQVPGKKLKVVSGFLSVGFVSNSFYLFLFFLF